MEKLAYLQQKKLNPADELRGLLTAIEQYQSNMKSINSTEAVQLVHNLDQAFSLLEQLEKKGLKLEPELGRFDFSQARIKQEAKRLLKALGGPSGLEEYRPSPIPAPERWWWYINEIVAERRRQALRRAATSFAVILLIIGGIILAFNTILAPSPEAVARVEAENDANQAIETGDYQTALASIEVGLSQIPDDPGLLIYKGVLDQTLGNAAAAEQSFAAAQAQLVDNPLAFYLARSQIFIRLNRPELAEQDARTVIDQDENIARAWLFLGQSLQVQGRNFEAAPAYERAGDIALENGENEIVVLARLALGNLAGAAPQ